MPLTSRMMPLALAAALFCGALPASADPSVDAAVNASRSNALGSRGELRSVAASSASRQAANGAISHIGLGGLTSVCSAAGEIVGAGSSVAAVFEAFRKSSVHWDQIVRPSWTAMGSAAVTGGDGRVYVSVVFCTESGAAPAPAPAPAPTPAPAPQPVSAPAAAPPAPAPTAPPAVVFDDLFLLLGERDARWEDLIDGVPISLVVGPSAFVPEANWRTLACPTVT